MRIFAAIHFQLERTKPVSKMMDDSAVSAGDQSLSGSEGGVVSDERFCTGEEHVASCARYLSQVLGIELVVVMCVCVCVCVCAGVAGVGSARGSRERVSTAEGARAAKHSPSTAPDPPFRPTGPGGTEDKVGWCVCVCVCVCV